MEYCERCVPDPDNATVFTGRDGCPVCGGAGFYDPGRLYDFNMDQPPEWFTDCLDFLHAACLVERHGLDGALTALSEPGRRAEWDPRFLELLGLYQGEVDRFEHEADVRRFARMRKR